MNNIYLIKNKSFVEKISDNYNLKMSEKAVLMCLMNYSNSNDNTCFPGLKTIAKEISASVSTVQRALKRLLNIGVISKDVRFRDNNSQTSNLYAVITDESRFSEVANENLNKQETYMRNKKNQIINNLKTKVAAIQDVINENVGIKSLKLENLKLLLEYFTLKLKKELKSYNKAGKNEHDILTKEEAVKVIEETNRNIKDKDDKLLPVFLI